MELTSTNNQMKKVLRVAGAIPSVALYPITRNATFFVFMFILGITCGMFEIPDSNTTGPYPHLFTELFTELYILCALLAAMPQRVRRWIRGIVCAVLYAAAIADVWCFVRSFLAPT